LRREVLPEAARQRRRLADDGSAIDQLQHIFAFNARGGARGGKSKEARESWTRLRVCEACQSGPKDEARMLTREAAELVAIVGAIVRNTRRNAGLSPLAKATDRREFPIPNCKL
jgi:hypothetical protein